MIGRITLLALLLCPPARGAALRSPASSPLLVGLQAAFSALPPEAARLASDFLLSADPIPPPELALALDGWHGGDGARAAYPMPPELAALARRLSSESPEPREATQKSLQLGALRAFLEPHLEEDEIAPLAGAVEALQQRRFERMERGLAAAAGGAPRELGSPQSTDEGIVRDNISNGPFKPNWTPSRAYRRVVEGRLYVLRDGRRELRPGVTGRDGYVAYADAHHAGNMNWAFQAVSAVLSPQEFRALRWGKQFIGTTAEHAQIRARVLDQDGHPLPGLSDPEGYVSYSDAHHPGANMQAPFINVSAVLSPQEFDDIGWGKQFNGSTAEYAWYRSQILPGGGLNMDYRGPDGLSSLVEHAMAVLGLDGGDSKRVRQNFRAVLTEGQIAELGWRKGRSPR